MTPRTQAVIITNKMKITVSFLATAISLLLFETTSASSVIIDLDYRGKECVAVRCPAPHTWHVSAFFEVVGEDSSDGSRREDVLGTLHEISHDRTVREKTWSSADDYSGPEYDEETNMHKYESGFHLSTNSGGKTYELCFENRSGHGVRVGFDLHAQKDADHSEGETVEQKYLSNLVDSVHRLEDSYRHLLEHNHYGELADKEHSEILKSILNNVTFWNIAKACSLLVAAAGQCMYVVRYLDQRKRRYY